jgi:hypothetical protein
MRPGKINLEKIAAALTAVCPHCQAILTPADWQRVDGERVKCKWCSGLFVPARGREQPKD